MPKYQPPVISHPFLPSSLPPYLKRTNNVLPGTIYNAYNNPALKFGFAPPISRLSPPMANGFSQLASLSQRRHMRKPGLGYLAQLQHLRQAQALQRTPLHIEPLPNLVPGFVSPDPLPNSLIHPLLRRTLLRRSYIPEAPEMNDASLLTSSSTQNQTLEDPLAPYSPSHEIKPLTTEVNTNQNEHAQGKTVATDGLESGTNFFIQPDDDSNKKIRIPDGPYPVVYDKHRPYGKASLNYFRTKSQPAHESPAPKSAPLNLTVTSPLDIPTSSLLKNATHHDLLEHSDTSTSEKTTRTEGKRTKISTIGGTVKAGGKRYIVVMLDLPSHKKTLRKNSTIDESTMHETKRDVAEPTSEIRNKSTEKISLTGIEKVNPSAHLSSSVHLPAKFRDSISKSSGDILSYKVLRSVEGPTLQAYRRNEYIVPPKSKHNIAVNHRSPQNQVKNIFLRESNIFKNIMSRSFLTNHADTKNELNSEADLSNEKLVSKYAGGGFIDSAHTHKAAVNTKPVRKEAINLAYPKRVAATALDAPTLDVKRGYIRKDPQRFSQTSSITRSYEHSLFNNTVSAQKSHINSPFAHDAYMQPPYLQNLHGPSAYNQRAMIHPAYIQNIPDNRIYAQKSIIATPYHALTTNTHPKLERYTHINPLLTRNAITNLPYVYGGGMNGMNQVFGRNPYMSPPHSQNMNINPPNAGHAMVRQYFPHDAQNKQRYANNRYSYPSASQLSNTFSASSRDPLVNTMYTHNSFGYPVFSSKAKIIPASTQKTPANQAYGQYNPDDTRKTMFDPAYARNIRMNQAYAHNAKDVEKERKSLVGQTGPPKAPQSFKLSKRNVIPIPSLQNAMHQSVSQKSSKGKKKSKLEHGAKKTKQSSKKKTKIAEQELTANDNKSKHNESVGQEYDSIEIQLNPMEDQLNLEKSHNEEIALKRNMSSESLLSSVVELTDLVTESNPGTRSNISSHEDSDTGSSKLNGKLLRIDDNPKMATGPTKRIKSPILATGEKDPEGIPTTAAGAPVAEKTPDTKDMGAADAATAAMADLMTAAVPGTDAATESGATAKLNGTLVEPFETNLYLDEKALPDEGPHKHHDLYHNISQQTYEKNFNFHEKDLLDEETNEKVGIGMQKNHLEDMSEFSFLANRDNSDRAGFNTESLVNIPHQVENVPKGRFHIRIVIEKPPPIHMPDERNGMKVALKMNRTARNIIARPDAVEKSSGGKATLKQNIEKIVPKFGTNDSLSNLTITKKRENLANMTMKLYEAAITSANTSAANITVENERNKTVNFTSVASDHPRNVSRNSTSFVEENNIINTTNDRNEISKASLVALMANENITNIYPVKNSTKNETSFTATKPQILQNYTRVENSTQVVSNRNASISNATSLIIGTGNYSSHNQTIDSRLPTTKNQIPSSIFERTTQNQNIIPDLVDIFKDVDDQSDDDDATNSSMVSSTSKHIKKLQKNIAVAQTLRDRIAKTLLGHCGMIGEHVLSTFVAMDKIMTRIQHLANLVSNKYKVSGENVKDIVYEKEDQVIEKFLRDIFVRF